MSTLVAVIRPGANPIIKVGESTAEATRAATAAAASAAAALTQANRAEAEADAAQVTLGLVQAAALAGDTIYPTTAAGLAGTAEGGYFWTANPPTLWREVSGAAVRQSVLLTDSQVVRLFPATADIVTATGISGNRIATLGFAARADGGGAVYDRWQVPMAALRAQGQGIWWFQDADGARWFIAEAPEHMAAQFGALGGAGIDARPILNEAFQAPTVRQINLGARTHFISIPGLRPASGKNLVGINREVSWLRVIPVTGLTTGQNFAVGRVNDVGGLCRDYSIDCQRSHFGIGTHGHPHGHVIYGTRQSGGTGICREVNVVRVDVHNCYGYAHYTTTGTEGDGLLVEDTSREDCRAFNFNVGFEEVGNVNRHFNVRPVAIAAPQDGGSLLTTECLYHQYGAIKDVVNTDPYGRGTAGAGVSIFTTENSDIDKVHYINPDVDVTAGFGLFVEARNAAGTNNPANGTIRAIRDIRIVGGRIRATGTGALVGGATVRLESAPEIVGLNGPGLECSQNNPVIEIYSAEIESNRPTGGGTAALGIAFNGTGQTVRWHGSGRLRAVGPAGSEAVNLARVQWVGRPEFFPSFGPTDLVIKDRMFRFPFSGWIVGDAGQNYYVTVDLSPFGNGLGGTGVRDIAKMHIQPTLEIPFPSSGIVGGTRETFKVLWLNAQTVRVYIVTNTALTDHVLKVRVTEFA